MELSQEEIDRRMTQWRNDRMLEDARKKRTQELEARCAALERENEELKATNEKLFLRIEQLEIMIFGKKRDDDDADGQSPADAGASAPKTPKKQRPPSSYRRAIPPLADVTDKKHFPIDDCPECGEPLQRKETVIRYEEDIPLPKKIVTEQTIERGFCPNCKKWKSAIPLHPQHCSLGTNIRLSLIFAITVLGLTFEKIKAYLRGLHHLEISDGEIAAIVQDGHRRLLPARQQINAIIDAAPAKHFDETIYPVQHGEQGNHAWVKTSATGPETVYLLGRSRGKDNALELRGPASAQPAVTDDYAAYDNLFENHGLCWTHPLRKFRDLAESKALKRKNHQRCLEFYEQFHALERSVAAIVTLPFDQEQRNGAAREISERIDALMQPDAADFSVLARYKCTFLEHGEKYLLCIRMRDVPMTNNKAERAVKGLVIKRLVSFGCRSQKGAQAMETILSVCMTLWWRNPEDYFGELRKLMVLG